jgi:hypothetical protein
MEKSGDFQVVAGNAVRPATLKRTGGCHCGAVRFEVELEAGFRGSRCNCSICQKLGAIGVILKPAAFRLITGEDSLGRYQWGARISTRHFCKHCGVYCFGAGHLAEIGGDFTSPNLNCLDEFDVNELELNHWDGRHNNWMAGPRSTPWPLRTVAREDAGAEVQEVA